MRRWLGPVNEGQGLLFPHDARSWLPSGHRAWRVLEVAGQLDLSAMERAYRADGQGQAPYDPRVMTALLLYCHLKGIRSSREVAAACVDDVGCRVITGGAMPSHKAVAEFRRRHRDALKGLFVQVLGLLAAEGALQGGTASVDGSPASASASRAGLTAAQLDARIAAVQAELDAAAARWADAAAQGTLGDRDDRGDGDDRDRGDGDGDGGGAAPGLARLNRLARKLDRLRAARAALGERALTAQARDRLDRAASALARAEAKLAAAEDAQAAKVARYQATLAAGRKWRYGPRVPVPASRNVKVAALREAVRKARARLAAARAAAAPGPAARISPADPGSRTLPAKDGGGWLQGYNIQLAAARRQVLLAIATHDNPADAGALLPVITAAIANLAAAGVPPSLIRAWLADSGYASAATFAALAEQKILAVVAIRKDAIQAARQAPARAALHGWAQVPGDWQKMAARLATPAGKALYKRRGPQVEPAFAQLFARFGRYLAYRGHDAVDAELHLLATVHNIHKLLAHRARAAPA